MKYDISLLTPFDILFDTISEFFLADTLTFYPTIDLASSLTSFLAYTLTSFLAFYLVYLWKFFLVEVRRDRL